MLRTARATAGASSPATARGGTGTGTRGRARGSKAPRPTITTAADAGGGSAATGERLKNAWRPTSAARRRSRGSDRSPLVRTGIGATRAAAISGITTTRKTRGNRTTTRTRAEIAEITGIAIGTTVDTGESVGVDHALASRIHSRGEIRQPPAQSDVRVPPGNLPNARD